MRPLVLATFALPVLTSCWDLPPGDVTSVYYWSDAMLTKYGDELVIDELEPGPPPLAHKRTVLLVTGVTIKARWFDPIVARLRRDGFEPVVYEPPELLSGNLFAASAELKTVVERVRDESGQDKIDILAECTGGVIARYYIQSLGGDAAVSRLVTFVSPQHGVAKAPLAAAIAGWPALDDLSPGSAFLNAVNDAPLPTNVPITSIYTCTDEWIQPYETSIIPGATNIGLCDGVVGHFQTFYDPSIYLLMHSALVAPSPGDPAEPVADEPVTDGPTEPQDVPVAPLPEASQPEPGADAPQVIDDPTPIGGMGCEGGGTGLGGLALAWLTARRNRTKHRAG